MPMVCVTIENILFNLPYVEERYRRTLEVCALDNDLKILEDGDESEIGERGVGTESLTSITLDSTLTYITFLKVNLSGGQKARGMFLLYLD
jgi:hypothetical protein